MNRIRKFPKFNNRVLILVISAVWLFLFASPAFANSPMAYGMYLSVASGAMSIATYGIAGVLIIAIESWFFKRYWNYSWLKAILFTIGINLASTAIGGIYSTFMFLNSCFLLPSFAIVPFVTWRVSRHKPPKWFLKITIPLFIVGAFIAGCTSNLIGPLPKILLLLAVEVPLLYGFAMTLMIESSIGSWFNRESNFWRTITLANVASYILLIFLFPFFAPNPYTYVGTWGLEHTFSNWSSELPDPGPEKAIAFLHNRRSSTTYLLGLSKNNNPPLNYDANYELNTLKDAPSHSWTIMRHMDKLNAIIDDTLGVSTLTPDARAKLLWFKQYLALAKPVLESIQNDDQDGLNQSFENWRKWFKENKYPDESDKYVGEYLNPSEIIKDIFEWKPYGENSKLRYPSKESSE